jgi:hypothetical protein
MRDMEGYVSSGRPKSVRASFSDTSLPFASGIPLNTPHIPTPAPLIALRSLRSYRIAMMHCAIPDVAIWNVNLTTSRPHQ